MTADSSTAPRASVHAGDAAHRSAITLGLPLDRLFAVYMIASLPALAFPQRPATWPLILLLHATIVAAGWPAGVIGAQVQRAAPRVRRAIRFIADWLPLLAIPVLYAELAVLNRAVHGGRYFDDTIIAWEQALFGGQPSRDWAVATPELWISEPLHAAYLSYYLIIFLPPLLLFLRGRRAEFRAGVFALMLSFFAHYMFFIYFPVQGPRYLFPAHAGGIESGFFYQLAHRILEAGSSQGAAFPSSHVGVSVTQTLVVWRYLPRWTPLFALLTIGLALGAIYGGFHYAIDAVCGLVLGIAAFIAAPGIARRLAGRTT